MDLMDGELPAGIRGLLKRHTRMDPALKVSTWIANADLAQGNIHVLVRVLPLLPVSASPVPEPLEPINDALLWSAALSGNEWADGVAGDWDIDLWQDNNCGTLKDTTAIANILPFFPKAYFVRLEELQVLKIFRDEYAAELQPNGVQVERKFLMLGSPGVGTSCLMVLICFWLAVKLKRPVLLLRRVASSVDPPAAYLFTGRKYFKWDEDVKLGVYKSLYEAYRRSNDSHWGCLDGFNQEELSEFRLEHRFRLMATLPRFRVSSESSSFVTACLLPFWTKQQLLQWEDHGAMRSHEAQPCEFEACYSYSGGSIRGFRSGLLLDTDHALSTLAIHPVNALRQGWGHGPEQLDRIRLVKVDDVDDRRCSVSPADWKGVVTSRYALNRIFEWGR